MKSTLLKQQHEKCVKILEMIDQCTERINRTKKYLANRRAFNYSWNEELLETTIAMKARLIKYYANQFTRMVKPVVESSPELMHELQASEIF